MSDFQTFKEEYTKLRQRPAVTITLPAGDAWVLLIALQYILTRDLPGKWNREIVRGVAKDLESKLATTPMLARLAEQGWNAMRDAQQDD